MARRAVGWNLKTVTAGSGKRFSGKCDRCGYKFIETPNNATKFLTLGYGRYINQVLISGVNDLATTHPFIAREADGWDPKEFNAGS